MRHLITDYVFDASAQTITFSGYAAIIIERILIITNVVDNIIIYNFAAVGKGGTCSSNVLTLDYNTTGMDDADELQIFYEIPDKSEYAIMNTESAGLYKYFGFQNRAGEWYIMRKTISTKTFLYFSDSGTTYSSGWSNRASHTYTDFSQI